MLACIQDDARALPAGWTDRHAAGMAIYRNNYRTALVEALRATFERTERLVGEASFAQAAAHHVILHPPTSWTLDLAGEGFDTTCDTLFTHDPEVAELAWLEWAMHRAFVARDAAPLDPAGFAAASAGFGEAEWNALRLRFVDGLAVATVRHDLKALWQSLGEAPTGPVIEPLAEQACAVVWREAHRPVFILVPAAEGAALEAMLGGASYGDTCAIMAEMLGEEAAIPAAGAMLGRWLREGMIEALV